MNLTYRPLKDWPELAQAFIEDLQQCSTHSEAAAFFEPLEPADKAALWAALPRPLRKRLRQLKTQGAA